MDATTKEIRKEGWLIFWNENWGHIQSAEQRGVKYFLHINSFHSQANRAPFLGERLRFSVQQYLGRAKGPTKLLRAVDCRPWEEDESANEVASLSDAAEFLRAVGEL
jgi:hypothetical protein